MDMVYGVHGSEGEPALEEENQSGAFRELAYRTQPGIVVLCAEPGMGSSRMLRCALEARYARGMATRYEDLGSLDCDETYKRLREALRWCIRQEREDGVKENPAFIAFDRYSVGDEADTERHIAVFRNLVAHGALVGVVTLPENAMLCDLMNECAIYWSCELCLSWKSPGDLDATQDFTRGIPVLVDAVSKIGKAEDQKIATHPGYLEPYITLVEQTLRPTLMNEERRLRLALLLLGTGTRLEVEGVVGEAEDDLWRELARDVPLLGMDLVRQSFACAGASSLDCLNASYAVLGQAARPWPHVVARAARVLAERGEYARAAVISRMCRLDRERYAVALEWSFEFVDVGEVDVVADGYDGARGAGLTALPGYTETGCLLASLGTHPWPAHASETLRRVDSLGARRAASLLAVHTVERDGRGSGVLLCDAQCDCLGEALLAHARALTALLSGHFSEAHDMLLNAPARLRDSSVFSGIVQMDYVLCSLMLGITPSDLDMDALVRAHQLFDRSGLTQLMAYQDLAFSVGALLGGRLSYAVPLEHHVRRMNRRGAQNLQAALLAVAAVSDLRIGAFTRAHVRLEQALRLFERVGSRELFVLCRILSVAVRSQLGEKIATAELDACQGLATATDHVMLVVRAAVLPSKRKVTPGAGKWGQTRYPGEIHWLLNVLADDLGGFSKRFKTLLPLVWDQQLTNQLNVVDGFLETRHQQRALPLVFEGRHVAEATTTAGARTAERKGKPRKAVKAEYVELRLLGGFEILLGGMPVLSGRLDRRRAKSLLALLAGMPGHVVKRFMIMESIWPTYDYESANRCVYSATTVIRAELAPVLDAGRSIPLVVANKAEGTVSLNTSAVHCDVDAFETKARRLVDMDGQDRAVVTLCREVEELYRGDLFVPPTDGMGLMGSRSLELRALYADAMIAGANAAMNLGIKTIACRFARKAHHADETREDALRVLVTALCGAGRKVEAERYFEQFIGKVVEATRRPPTKELRRAVEELLQGALRADSSVPYEGVDARLHMVEEPPGMLGTQLSFDFDVQSDAAEDAADDESKQDAGSLPSACAG